VVEHRIETEDAVPIKKAPYCVPLHSGKTKVGKNRRCWIKG
jgi:hypothetical protein